ncbi:hypothetical protein AB0F36_27540 [Streptomyces sp. NPDC029080]
MDPLLACLTEVLLPSSLARLTELLPSSLTRLTDHAPRQADLDARHDQ